MKMHETSYTYTAKTLEIYSMMQKDKNNVTTSIITKPWSSKRKNLEPKISKKKGHLNEHFKKKKSES